MYIKREIDHTLEAWKNTENRKPLLLRGVRQCGKTTAVRELAKGFDHYLEINLEKQVSLHSAFEGDLDIRRILSRLEIETGVPVKEGRTLLFIDEIQACPRAITALRYFYEDIPALHVIAAGSLLEFVLNNKKSARKIEFPVGRVRSVYMYPFSFLEFLTGTGQEMLRAYLCRLRTFQEPNDLHAKLLESYKTFLVVGGMPEAVAEYAANGSLLSCQQIHRDIMVSFKEDLDKYDSDIPTDILRKVFEYTFHNVCRQVKSSSAIPGVSAYYFDECIKLLRRAGLIYPVMASSCETIPLGASQKEANKKLLAFDTGVYLTECKLNVGELLAAEVFDEINRGDVVEMETGLEIIKYADPCEEAEVFYWYRTGANAEVDYVIQRDESILPVEVKASGKGSMQSMRSYLKTHGSVPYGIRVSLENFTAYENIRVFPVYAVSRI